jgi:hypothetical protein
MCTYPTNNMKKRDHQTTFIQNVLSILNEHILRVTRVLSILNEHILRVTRDMLSMLNKPIFRVIRHLPFLMKVKCDSQSIIK